MTSAVNSRAVHSRAVNDVGCELESAPPANVPFASPSGGCAGSALADRMGLLLIASDCLCLPLSKLCRCCANLSKGRHHPSRASGSRTDRARRSLRLAATPGRHSSPAPSWSAAVFTPPWSATVFTPPWSATVFPLCSRPPPDGRVRRGSGLNASEHAQLREQEINLLCERALALDAHGHIRLGDCLRQRQRRVE